LKRLERVTGQVERSGLRVRVHLNAVDELVDHAPHLHRGFARPEDAVQHLKPLGRPSSQLASFRCFGGGGGGGGRFELSLQGVSLALQVYERLPELLHIGQVSVCEQADSRLDALGDGGKLSLDITARRRPRMLFSNSLDKPLHGALDHLPATEDHLSHLSHDPCIKGARLDVRRLADGLPLGAVSGIGVVPDLTRGVLVDASPVVEAAMCASQQPGEQVAPSRPR